MRLLNISLRHLRRWLMSGWSLLLAPTLRSNHLMLDFLLIALLLSGTSNSSRSFSICLCRRLFVIFYPFGITFLSFFILFRSFLVVKRLYTYILVLVDFFLYNALSLTPFSSFLVSLFIGSFSLYIYIIYLLYTTIPSP